MAFLRLGFVLALLFGCGRTVLPIEHTLRHRDPSKPTPQCTEARDSVDELLVEKGLDKSIHATTIRLPTGSCGVMLFMLENHDRVGDLAKALKEKYHRYTHVRVGGQWVNLWLDEKAEYTNPPTLAECEATLKVLQAEPNFNSAQFRVVVWGSTPHPSLGCFVEGIFEKDEAFEAFLKWKNPLSKTELFHAQFEKTKASVWIRVLN